MRKGLQIAGALIVLALILGVIGLVLRVVRWLLYLAAAVFVIGALFGALGGRSDSTG